MGRTFTSINRSAIIVIGILAGPLWFGLLLLMFRLVTALQNLGLQPKSVLVRNTIRDPALLLPFFLQITLFFGLLWFSYSFLAPWLRLRSNVVRSLLWFIGIPIGLVFVCGACSITFLASTALLATTRFEFQVQEYRVAVMEQPEDLDYHSFYVYIIRNDGSFYRERMNPPSRECGSFQVQPRANILVLQLACTRYIVEDIIEIDPTLLSIRNSYERAEGKSFRTIASLPFVNP